MDRAAAIGQRHDAPGAAATPTVTREALFRQAGITATLSIEELVEAAALLHAQPLPAPRGAVAVGSNAGAIGILAADVCADAGLVRPELPDAESLIGCGAEAGSAAARRGGVGRAWSDRMRVPAPPIGCARRTPLLPGPS
ncbi:hypothetical protein [Streptomyces sp. 1114.5]|uniref:hypothetical protein n=1 Tax=Streptomyces sp. 1114.5 TaxID=1938830 RepID=UPI0037DA7988